MSTSSTMLKKFTPTLVYQRKRQLKSSAISAVQISYSSKLSNGCHSAISSEAPSLATQGCVVSVSEGATDAIRSPVMMGSVDCDTVGNTPLNECHTEVEAGSEVTLTTDVGGTLNTCSANDNYSSSKPNVELSSVSLKRDMDEAGECSSSGGLIADKASKEISERDICISILRSQGLFDKVQRRQDQTSAGNSSISNTFYCSKPCKVCERLERTLGMLVCDNCEDAFHISCYNPRITVLPIGEWLCSSCLNKMNKTLSDQSTSNSGNNNTEIDRNQHSTSEGQLGSFGFMFRDTEPYLSSVRIGSDFQVDIPDFCGQDDEANHFMGDPLDEEPPNVINMKKRDAIKTVKLSSIGNWIQCQEVMEGLGEGVDGTICGKWRRAPLFEVQTDDWECFQCILWDPAHADCAVPQEVGTEEVRRQLKYIEMLRPQLADKRRKLVSSRRNGT